MSEFSEDRLDRILQERLGTDYSRMEMHPNADCLGINLTGANLPSSVSTGCDDVVSMPKPKTPPGQENLIDHVSLPEPPPEEVARISYESLPEPPPEEEDRISYESLLEPPPEEEDRISYESSPEPPPKQEFEPEPIPEPPPEQALDEDRQRTNWWDTFGHRRMM